MMNEEKILLVARYLEGDMNLQEQAEFEVSVQSDSELQALLAEYKNVHQTLKMKIAPSDTDKQVEASLESFNKQYFSATKVVSFKQYLRWMSVAAVLIIGLFVWAPWSTGLYEKYAISKQMSVAERGEENENNLEKAAEFYNDGNFRSASELLQKEYTSSPDNAMVGYYYGVSLIETGKLEEARIVLTKIYDGQSVFKYDAAYYMGLSYVKEKNNQEALIWLRKIPKGINNSDRTEELIRKLSRE